MSDHAHDWAPWHSGIGYPRPAKRVCTTCGAIQTGTWITVDTYEVEVIPDDPGSLTA